MTTFGPAQNHIDIVASALRRAVTYIDEKQAEAAADTVIRALWGKGFEIVERKKL